jgi:hypothetical protein
MVASLADYSGRTGSERDATEIAKDVKLNEQWNACAVRTVTG